MHDLILTSQAFDDILSARRWYESRREGLGAAFEDALEATFARLRRLPHAGKAIEPPFRQVALRRFPYEVFYEFDSERGRIVIVLVFHTSRDPAAASARLREH